jgi:hypothetical protein
VLRKNWSASGCNTLSRHARFESQVGDFAAQICGDCQFQFPKRSPFHGSLKSEAQVKGKTFAAGLVIGVALGVEIGLAAVLELANRKKSS